jgi:hypothetical protein
MIQLLVKNYLLTQGLDVSNHRRRTLTPTILEEAGFVIAISTERRSILAERFNRADVPLFTEACGLPSESLRDIEEVVIDHKTNPAAVEAHIRKTIDRIIELTPQLAKQLQTERSA